MSSEEEPANNDEIKHLSDVEKEVSLNVAFKQEIRPLIDLIDKLRRFGIQQDIKLPNVVVVGDQSSGKSSIIEALSGVELPRGKGIVTRCPLELQLKRVVGKEWTAKISYRKSNGESEEFSIDRPGDVECNVRRAQEVICGVGKGVSSELLTLRIESPEESAPDLTLIDLPGIARIALDDQPADVCETIQRMIMNHINNPRTVILCIVASNLDIAVNEALKIAKNVDPNYERTIAVLTKPDTTEESNKEDILALLNNEKIKLQKGFSMVKCRSQIELDEEISLKQSIQNEKEFFKCDRVFRQATSSQLGTMNLAKKISQELVDIIKKTLPELKTQLDSEMQKAFKELDLLAESVPTDTIEKQAYLTRLIWNLVPIMKECLTEGKLENRTENNFYRWRKSFEEFLKAMEDKTKSALSRRFSVSNLNQLIERARGRELCGFHDFDIFKKEIPSHIETYMSDATKLLKTIKVDVERSLCNVVSTKVKHLPEISKEINGIINDELNNFEKLAADKINFIFQQESIIFTMDVIFNKDMDEYKKRIAQALVEEQKRASSNAQYAYDIEEKKDSNPEDVHGMLQVYLNIVNHRLSDIIPLTIMQCLLMDLAKSMDRHLVNLCTSPNMIAKVQENSSLTEHRKRIKDKIQRLDNAIREISRF